MHAIPCWRTAINAANYTDKSFLILQDIDLMPSHIVPSLTQDKEHNDVYSAYNKPGAVMYWLRVSHMGCYCPVGSWPSASTLSKSVTPIEQSFLFRAHFSGMTIANMMTLQLCESSRVLGAS